MAGLIKADDIALVKERSSLEDVVREQVTLRPAGPGSLKGLCPFHDEKSPSFNIRPAVGAWYCFGCGEGGDVISFVQQVEHLTFAEAVERLAAKLGMELHYEDGVRPREEGLGRRSRLVEAHRVAAEFFAAALVKLHEARAGRDFLRERGFDRAAAERFGVGFAPRPVDALSGHLRAKGFTDDEITAGGLAGRGSVGLYDRFRGRLVWPIRDITGDVIGFGARRLFDDDRIEAKYLNTAETAIYKKSGVLYGLDLAKRSIARDRQAVVVEGYTDVMACHLAGVQTAVATCGTAFGVDHIKMLRRIMRDFSSYAAQSEYMAHESNILGRAVFTFDGDQAGQKAAMRAFEEDQRWASQSFVAVEASGKDPCELRQSSGDLAVRALIEDAVPMFEFAVRTTIHRFDLATAEGRVQGLRSSAPIIAGIRDRSLRREYTRTVAGWLGVEVEQVAAEVSRASRMAARTTRGGAARPSDSRSGDGRSGDGRGGDGRGGDGRSGDARGGDGRTGDARSGDGRSGDGRGQDSRRGEGSEPPDGHLDVDEPPDIDVEPDCGEVSIPRPDLRDPAVAAERQLLQTVLQFPSAIDVAGFEAIDPSCFSAPAHRVVHDAIRAAGGPSAARTTAGWAIVVSDAVPSTVRPLVSELAVANVPARFDPATGLPERRYLDGLLIRVREVSLTRQVADAMSALRRMDSADPAAARVLGIRLQALQHDLAALRAKQD